MESGLDVNVRKERDKIYIEFSLHEKKFIELFLDKLFSALDYFYVRNKISNILSDEIFRDETFREKLKERIIDDEIIKEAVINSLSKKLNKIFEGD